jgi:chemotaxis protein CheX
VTALESDVWEITAMVWSSLFNLPLERAGSASSDDEPAVTGFLSIDGAWNGAVMLRCAMPLATDLTEAMFQGPDAATFADISDAIGELTNMIAGNVKALLPSPCNLSLPAVALGSDYALSVLGTTALAQVFFTCEGQPLMVTVLQRSVDERSGQG